MAPCLQSVRFPVREPATDYPWNIPAWQGLNQLVFDTAVTFFVGENGSGKSTLLEAIAVHAGFSPEGGTMSARFSTRPESADAALGWADALRLAWFPRAHHGFFLRAESLFNVASYIDQLDDNPSRKYRGYGGRSPHAQSHGESFLALMRDGFDARGPALYLLDEPEAALSPSRQLAFLRLLHEYDERGAAQFIIASHSPILLGYPGASLITFDRSPMRPIGYEDTEHYRVTKAFLMSRPVLLRELWREDL